MVPGGRSVPVRVSESKSPREGTSGLREIGERLEKSEAPAVNPAYEAESGDMCKRVLHGRRWMLISGSVHPVNLREPRNQLPRAHSQLHS